MLDRSRTREGEPDAQALHRSIARARRAESLGYERFWVAEHHAVPGVASGSPPVLVAAIAAGTERIRVGSGGVMLPNHQPFVVAEQFAMLQALHPGRVDLGVGRSLGFTPPVRRALRVVDADVERFADDLSELLGYLSGEGLVTVRPRTPAPPVFVLATGQGVEVAAHAGLPVVVGGPALKDDEAADRYRDSFVSRGGSAPYVVVSLDVMVADTEGRARDLLLPEAWAMAVSRETGVFEALRSVESIKAATVPDRRRRAMERTMDHAIAGDAESVRQQLEELVRRTGADEVLASTSTFDVEALAVADTALAALFASARGQAAKPNQPGTTVPNR